MNDYSWWGLVIGLSFVACSYLFGRHLNRIENRRIKESEERLAALRKVFKEEIAVVQAIAKEIKEAIDE